MDLRSQYGSEHLDRIFIFAMRAYLHATKYGLFAVGQLPVVIHGEEAVVADDFLALAVELILQGQPPDIIDVVLEAEYQGIVKQNALTKQQILELYLIKVIIPPVVQQHRLEMLNHYINLWKHDANQYANLTFFPNLSAQEREQMHVLEKFLPPQDMWRLDDF